MNTPLESNSPNPAGSALGGPIAGVARGYSTLNDKLLKESWDLIVAEIMKIKTTSDLRSVVDLCVLHNVPLTHINFRVHESPINAFQHNPMTGERILVRIPTPLTKKSADDWRGLSAWEAFKRLTTVAAESGYGDADVKIIEGCFSTTDFSGGIRGKSDHEILFQRAEAALKTIGYDLGDFVKVLEETAAARPVPAEATTSDVLFRDGKPKAKTISEAIGVRAPEPLQGVHSPYKTAGAVCGERKVPMHPLKKAALERAYSYLRNGCTSAQEVQTALDILDRFAFSEREIQGYFDDEAAKDRKAAEEKAALAAAQAAKEKTKAAPSAAETCKQFEDFLRGQGIPKPYFFGPLGCDPGYSYAGGDPLKGMQWAQPMNTQEGLGLNPSDQGTCWGQAVVTPQPGPLRRAVLCKLSDAVYQASTGMASVEILKNATELMNSLYITEAELMNFMKTQVGGTTGKEA
jgi:hypothetical protein